MSSNMSLTDAFFDLYGAPKNNVNGLGQQPDSARSLGQAAQYILGVEFPSGPWSPRFGLAGTPGAGFGSSASADILNALGMVDNMTPRLLTGTHEPFPSSYGHAQPQQEEQSHHEQQQKQEDLQQVLHHHQQQQQPQQQQQQQLLPPQPHPERLQAHALPQPPQLQALQPLNLPPLNLPPLSFQLNTGAAANTNTNAITMNIAGIKAEPRLSGSSGPLPPQLQQQLLQRQSSDAQQQPSAEPTQQQQPSVDEAEQELEDEDGDSDSQGAATGGRGGRRRKPAAKSGRGAARGGVGKKGQAAAKARAAATVAAAAAAAVEVSPGRVLYTGTVGSGGLMQQTGEALPWSLSLQALNAQLAASSPGNTAWPAEADS